MLPQISVSPKAVLKCAGPRLVPFLKTLALYFVIYPEDSPCSLVYCTVKCLPILCLIGFVLSYSPVSSAKVVFAENKEQVCGSAQSSTVSVSHELKLLWRNLMSPEDKYRRIIFYGLLFSLLGDVFLVWKSQGLFMPGVFCFGIAQTCYTAAFSLYKQPLCLGVGIGCWVGGFFIISLFIPFMPSWTVVFACVTYVFLIFTMFWRALVRGLLPLGEPSSWTALSCFVGASLFVCSDILLCTDIFCFSLPHGNALIMSTYYLAQMCIAVSVMEGGEGLTPLFTKQC
jgi:uncharacterized membrane protein YhhN